MESGFRLIARALRYTAVLIVGIYGPTLPFVAGAAAAPRGMESTSSWDRFISAVDRLGTELNVPFDQTNGRIGNVEIVAASRSAVEFIVHDADDQIVGAGAFTSIGFVGGKAVTVIELDAGTLRRTYDLSVSVENNALTFEGTVSIVDADANTTTSYTGKGWIEGDEFLTTPDTDVGFAESIAALGGYTGEDPVQLLAPIMIGAGFMIALILGLAICAALEGCGPIGGWMTRVGDWLQSILL
jgi:hypothetical protein